MRPYFEDEFVTIYHGDALELIAEMVGVTVIVTDPPYRASAIGPNARVAVGGDMDTAAYRAFCTAWFSLARGLTERIAFTCGIRHIWDYPAADWVGCWYKPGAVAYNPLGGFNAWEPILFYGGRPPQTRLRIDAWEQTPLNFTTEIWAQHPCPKPPNVWRKLVESFTNSTDVILDPFMGSGTTLRVAKDLGRRAIGIDINDRYCHLAAERMRQGVLLREGA